ncbi:hypothetical protein [Paenibacillus lutrae]|uniref:Uncharacterized protein n=1 Tax=Paenibacillus lutrae TaxID=2078573 RepID=A0A7X3FK33_9BACL|nr:hypothetical protein [Paenibacillus lutrae]MVP00797.1 hypothetical protein [Paenibacillus lutrae]
MTISYLPYNDPLLITFRAGTAHDPYVERTESWTVANTVIPLHEIPSETHKVKISGYTEIRKEIFDRTRQLNEQEFYVNYQNGVVHFHSSREGETIVAQYKGRGVIQYPAERIYAHIGGNPDVVKNLQQIIEEALHKVTEAHMAIGLVNEAIMRCNAASDDAHHAADQANLARDDAEQAAREARDAASLTKKIYKAPVRTKQQLTTAYPKPETGWTVMVQNTGDIYRYDGANWIFIENWVSSALPHASDTVDGLMSKEDFTKFHNEQELRVITFLFNKPPQSGPQNQIIRFPLQGTIIKVHSYCSRTGLTLPTEIMIEKIDQSDLLNANTWTEVTSFPILIPPNQQLGSAAAIISPDVKAEDFFRINFIQLDPDIRGITVQIEIRI